MAAQWPWFCRFLDKIMKWLCCLTLSWLHSNLVWCWYSVYFFMPKRRITWCGYECQTSFQRSRAALLHSLSLSVSLSSIYLSIHPSLFNNHSNPDKQCILPSQKAWTFNNDLLLLYFYFSEPVRIGGKPAVMVFCWVLNSDFYEGVI